MARRWTAEEVLGLARSFQGACALVAAVDLELFSALARRPMTAARAAATLGSDPRGTEALLDALAAMELVTKKGDAYRLAPSVAELLTESGPHSVLPMVRHSGSCLRNWAQLGHVVKTGRPARRLWSIRGEEADRSAFIGGMHVVSARVAPRLIESLGPPRFRHLLDVGGGPGTWTLAFLRAAPHATATIFDLPSVVPLARRRVAEAGMGRRVTIVGGDYTKDKLPAGADLAWVSAIVHQESLQGNKALFRKVFAALEPGGRVLVRDVVMRASRTRPVMGALFALNMLVATESGGTYTFAELAEALRGAGFVRPKLLVKADDVSSVVGATKPTRRARRR